MRSDSNWENTQLRDLINARYSSLVSMVLVTSKTAEEINGTNGTPYFSTALRDRIREDGAMLKMRLAKPSSSNESLIPLRGVNRRRRI